MPPTATAKSKSLLRGGDSANSTAAERRLWSKLRNVDDRPFVAELGHRSKLRAAFLRTDGLRYIVTKRHSPGDTEERPMSHQPPKQGKKQSQHTPKEKKAIKQQKKHAGDVAPFLKK